MKRGGSGNLRGEQNTLLGDSLLRQMFPPGVVAALLANKPVQPELYKGAIIMFCDVVGWTTIAAESDPLEAHNLLNDLYNVLDYCLAQFPVLYKVETIGDSLMAIAGAPINLGDYTVEIVEFAILVNEVVSKVVMHPRTRMPLSLRIGLHKGDVVGGVMGMVMPRFSFSGDAVNVAARMQTLGGGAGGEPSIVVSSDFAACVARQFGLLADDTLAFDFADSILQAPLEAGASCSFGHFKLVSRGVESIKGRGEMATFSIQPIKDDQPASPSSSSSSSSSSTALCGKQQRNSSSFAPLTHAKIAREVGAVLERITTKRVDLLTTSKSLDDFSGADLQSVWSFGLPRTSSQASLTDMLDLRESVVDEAFEDSDDEEVKDPGSSSPSSPSLRRSGSRQSMRMRSGYSAGNLRRMVSTASLRSLNESSDATPLMGRVLEAIRASRALSSSSSPSDEAGGAVLRPAHLDHMNIVVVEDSALQAKIICRQLKNINPTWGVRVATSPEELLLLFEAETLNVDLILCDMMLGISSTDGPRLVADLRNRYGALMSEVVVVMMSKDCEERELISSRYAADGFWAKPLPSDAVLLSHILQLVNKKAYLLLSMGRYADAGADKTKTMEGGSGVGSGKRSSSSTSGSQSRSPSSACDPMTLVCPTVSSSSDRESDDEVYQVKRCRSDQSITIRSAPANQFSSSAGNMRRVEASWSRGQLVVEEPVGGIVEGLKICIVDDSQVQRRLLARTLSFYHSSWTVKHFPDSVECVRHLRANHFDVDVIFVDMNRHGGADSSDGVRGPDFVKMLREGLGLTRQVIISLNRDYREVEKSFLIAGADTAWSKPLPSKEIGLNRIRQLVLSRKGLSQYPAALS